MLSFVLSLNMTGRLLGAVAIVSAAIATLVLPGPLNIETRILFVATDQWQVNQSYEISPETLQAIDQGDESAEPYASQLSRLQAEASTDPDLSYEQQTRSDGWTEITVSGSGLGLERLNELFFDGAADIETSSLPNGQREVSILWSDLDPTPITEAGGTNTVIIAGEKILTTNSDRLSLNSDFATWINPLQVSVSLTELPGFRANLASSIYATGGLSPGTQAAVQQQQPAQPANLIRNGGFEMPWQQQDGVAPEWEGFDNGRAHFGWYEELWPEAVHTGERAQLMEIFQVEANILDRVMAIHQTVDVEPNTDYDLSLYALMRSDAVEEDRNQHEVEMHWGIDPFGEGNYDNVETWNFMPLTEQNRLGSFAENISDRQPLFYEHITGTIKTGPNADQITLFIRGLKKFPTNLEVNFDVDDVSLIPAQAQTGAVRPAPGSAPPRSDITLPSSGAVLPPSTASTGKIVLGSLVLLIVGTGAAISLFFGRKEL